MPTRREKMLIGACLCLATGLAAETVHLIDVRQELKAERARPFWPDQPRALDLEPEQASRFTPTTRRTIPDTFWGEFAEDVHDCGGEGSTLISGTAIAASETEQQSVTKIRWVAPEKIEVEADGGGHSTAFTMHLSEDRDEILFEYTNTKRIYQRCSSRAHGDPEAMKSAPATEAFAMNVDETLSVENVVAEDIDASQPDTSE